MLGHPYGDPSERDRPITIAAHDPTKEPAKQTGDDTDNRRDQNLERRSGYILVVDVYPQTFKSTGLKSHQEVLPIGPMGQDVQEQVDSNNRGHIEDNECDECDDGRDLDRVHYPPRSASGYKTCQTPDGEHRAVEQQKRACIVVCEGVQLRHNQIPYPETYTQYQAENDKSSYLVASFCKKGMPKWLVFFLWVGGGLFSPIIW